MLVNFLLKNEFLIKNGDKTNRNSQQTAVVIKYNETNDKFYGKVAFLIIIISLF